MGAVKHLFILNGYVLRLILLRDLLKKHFRSYDTSEPDTGTTRVSFFSCFTNRDFETNYTQKIGLNLTLN